MIKTAETSSLSALEGENPAAHSVSFLLINLHVFARFILVVQKALKLMQIFVAAVVKEEAELMMKTNLTPEHSWMCVHLDPLPSTHIPPVVY